MEMSRVQPIEDIRVEGNSIAAGIAGHNLGSIVNCSVSGTVMGKINVGGIVGHNTDCTIVACYNAADIDAIFR